MSSEDHQVSSDSDDGEENRALQPPDKEEEDILKDLVCGFHIHSSLVEVKSYNTQFIFLKFDRI